MNADYVPKRSINQEVGPDNFKKIKIEAKVEQIKYREDKDESDPRSRQCPYLDTINRNVLDFDFEKLCSITLSNNNVYACLVCGKYFQGRGIKSHAYTHSVELSHHVYINLNTYKFYCLPDNYQVIDSSLDDIKYVLNPTFTKEQISQLEKNSKLSRAYDGTHYLPGIVGLNNIKANDYSNVVLQALVNVPPLRDYFIREQNYANIKVAPGDIMINLVKRFGELTRKLWNPRNFKAHVSPHEMLQAVVKCSKKKFQITQQSDPIDFLSWLLNSLHLTLNGTKSQNSSIIYKTFQGQMKIYTRKIAPLNDESAEQQVFRPEDYLEKVEEKPFLYLSVDLPSPPLFRDELKESIIPQVPLMQILTKFDGVTSIEYKTYKENFIKKYELLRLPRYLIMCFRRFTKNVFYLEKNPTIVNFSAKNVDLKDLLSEENKKNNPNTVYDLIANIVHDGDPNKGTYRVHILHKGTGTWYEMQDLHVIDVLPQMITLSEAYIQIWEQRSHGENENQSSDQK
ncbi:U4 tri-snRNP-associated 2 [Brachionus plicatilis]|uniref:Ubiquitin carboxyl-terminal hydrolase 39 n=1 Tax=Brachionus plicatilis TaxID=10195 RepID=A0A3M7RCX1_BRAPC|nr:U4 tri-snRNP-associated 2 [Brachionus plicatilis]